MFLGKITNFNLMNYHEDETRTSNYAILTRQDQNSHRQKHLYLKKLNHVPDRNSTWKHEKPILAN